MSRRQAIAAAAGALRAYPGLAPLTGKVGLSRAMMAPVGAAAIRLPTAELAAYTGRFADPGTVVDFAVRGDELTALPRTIPTPDAMRPAVGPLPATAPVTVEFVAKDAVKAGDGLTPFVRNRSGDVAWVNAGLRLLPRSKPS